MLFILLYSLVFDYLVLYFFLNRALAYVKCLINIKFLPIEGYSKIINGFLWRFWPINLCPLCIFFIYIFLQIFYVHCKCQRNNQFSPLNKYFFCHIFHFTCNVDIYILCESINKLIKIVKWIKRLITS